MRLIRWLSAMVVCLPFGAQAQGTLLESRESVYNNIYVFEQGDHVIMQFGKNTQFWTESVYDRSDPKALPVAYTRSLTVALAYPPDPKSLLEIGLGGGRTAAYLNIHMPELAIHSVELDPDVIELAEKHFDLRQNDHFTISALDGRLHLMRDKSRHDVILVDAYRGPFVPFHLLTREFYLTAQRRLSENGVLAQNIEPTTMLFDSAIATLASVFDNVELYPASGNVVAIAYDGPVQVQGDLMTRAQQLQARHGFKYPLTDILDKRHKLSGPSTADPLVDDFAPVEMLKSVERHNQGIDDIANPVTK